MTSKSTKLEMIKHPPPPSMHKPVKGLVSECTVLKIDLLWDYPIYCLQVYFSSEILQAGAVKGLIMGSVYSALFDEDLIKEIVYSHQTLCERVVHECRKETKVPNTTYTLADKINFVDL